MTVFGLSETLKASSFVRGIRDEAKASDIWVSVGIHELSSEEDKQSETNGVNGHDGDKARERCYNTQCLISSDGEIASIYRKLHLFDVMKDVKLATGNAQSAVASLNYLYKLVQLCSIAVIIEFFL